MSSELVPASLDSRITYSKALAASDLLPKQYRGAPANVLVALEYGAALGLAPMAAIQGIHVVEGKPTASAQLIGALVRNAGHRLRVTGDNDQAVAVIVRSDDPDFEFRAEWTMERAKQAGLAGKAVWKQYPAAMLKARAITEVARDACPEVLSGVAYTDEELDHGDGQRTVDTSRITPPKPAPRVVAERVEPEPEVDTETGEIIEEPEPEDEPEAEPLDETPDMITPAQSRKLHATLRQLDIGDRDAGLKMLSDILAYDIGTTRDLTREEASMVIDTLDEMARRDG